MELQIRLDSPRHQVSGRLRVQPAFANEPVDELALLRVEADCDLHHAWPATLRGPPGPVKSGRLSAVGPRGQHTEIVTVKGFSPSSGCVRVANALEVSH